VAFRGGTSLSRGRDLKHLLGQLHRRRPSSASTEKPDRERPAGVLALPSDQEPGPSADIEAAPLRTLPEGPAGQGEYCLRQSAGARSGISRAAIERRVGFEGARSPPHTVTSIENFAQIETRAEIKRGSNIGLRNDLAVFVVSIELAVSAGGSTSRPAPRSGTARPRWFRRQAEPE